MVTAKVKELAENVVLILMILFIFQSIVNAGLLFIVRRFSGSTNSISFRIWGRTIRGLRVRTPSCKLRVGKIGLTFGKKIAVTFSDIDIVVLKDIQKTREEIRKNSDQVGSEPLDSVELLLSGKVLWILNKIFPLCCYFQVMSLRLLDGTVIKVDLSSVAVDGISEDKLRAEMFLHSICNTKKGDTIHNISYQLKCDMLRKEERGTKRCRVTMKNWSSYLRLNGLHFHVNDLMNWNADHDKHATINDDNNCNNDNTNDNTNNSDPTKNSNNDETEKGNIELDENVVNFYEAKLQNILRKYRGPIEILRVVDIKVEDLIISYKHYMHVKVSSIQFYMETVDIYSYGFNLEFLPSTVHKANNHEISMSVSTFTMDVKETSVIRIPFINNVITTDILSFLAHGNPITKAKISHNMNIINPSIVVTIKQVLDALTYFNKYKQMIHLRSDRLSRDPQTKNVALAILKKNVQSLPSFILKPAIWNFSSTLQFSTDEHMVFKFYSIQALLHRKNILLNSSGFDRARSRPELAFIERDPFSKQITNYLKISNVSLLFMKLPTSNTEAITTVPICGFERSDTFLDEKFDEKINIESTLRHLTLSLDDLDVLGKMHAVLFRILQTYNMGRMSDLADEESCIHTKKRSDNHSTHWFLQLRLKDFSCSLLLAKYLPVFLDPLATKNFNMSDISRGMIFVMRESFATASPEEKTFRAVTASLIRVMEDQSLKQVSDVVVDLKELSVVVRPSKTVQVTLPSVQFNVDVSTIWLIFFIKTAIVEYSSFPGKPRHKYPGKEMSNESSYSVALDIEKTIIEVMLPQNTPLLLSLEDIHYSPVTSVLHISNISIFVKSVYVKEIPVQVSLLNINDFEVILGDIGEGHSVKVSTSSIRFHTEYHFRFYMVVDNMINMFKSVKQIELAFSDLHKFHRLRPSQQHPVELTSIDIFTERFVVSVEEDPFEQELGLILKIGVLEQRDRLEKLQEFNEQRKRTRTHNERAESGSLFPTIESSMSSDIDLSDDISEKEAFQAILENFSTSWIARYRMAKLKFHGRTSRIVKRAEMGAERYFYSPLDSNTVGNLLIEKLHLNLGAPSFPIANFADFVHKYGKGVPKDRLYTLLLIMGVDIRTGLWELRLRDYPLPIVSFPDSHTTGDMVFGERMPEEKSLRTVYIPFIPAASRAEYSKSNSIYGSHIIRTMNSIKIFFNIKSKVQSPLPASITWGKSLQPGYTSLMLWFDYLTRPQEDPSPKMGFWDKFRFLVHGKWTYDFSEVSKFHLNIKGSQHPYKIADDGAGLSFCWSGGTTIHIHKSEDPKELLNIESKQFQLAVRDFTATNKFDKVLMKLAGHVIWKLGLLFEQGDIHKAGEEARLPPCKPHYEVELVHPSHVTDFESYDSFSGFRSDFIHMSIGVYSSAKGSSNNLYLAPHSVYHFLNWWNLFHTYTSGPIRQGPLFTDLVQNPMKFGKSLFTLKYQLHLEPLVLTHVYRHYTDFDDTNHVSFTGLKGKVQALRIDLHQKRVKLTHTNEKLKRSKPVWKFKMSTGELDCTEADIRILSAIFDRSEGDEILASRFGFRTDQKSFKPPLFVVNEKELKESEWYDYEDYIDLDQVSLESSILFKLEAIPLMYSPRISYFRKINDDGYVVPFPFGREESHDCMIGKNHPERTQEHLVRQRVAEIEKDIKKVAKHLESVQQSQEGPGNIKKVEAKVAALTASLHELKHRLHIVHIILDDLKLSEVAPSIYSSGDSESSVSSSFDSNDDSDESHISDSPLLRSTTIESFRSMRQASSLQVNSTYDNRFIVHSIQFKINKIIRQHLFEYASNAFERKSMQFFLTYKSVMILKELLNTTIVDAKTSSSDFDSFGTDEGVSNAEFVQRFEELIREVPSDNFDFVDSYLFRLISPQLQFMSDVEPDSAVILAARDIEMGIIDIMQIIGKSGQRIPMDIDTIVETRYCAVSKDIQLFTLSKQDIISTGGKGFHQNGYGMHEDSKFWPPWIPLEMCYDGALLEKHVFLRRRSMFFTYTSPNPLFFTDEDTTGLSKEAKFRVGFPGLVLTSTSQQYCAVYNITQDLLSFQSTLDEKVEKLAKVILADEVRNNLEKLDVSVVTTLQRKVKDLYYTREFLKVHDHRLYNKTAQELTYEIQTTLLELSILMTAVKKNYDRLVSGSKSSQKKLNWHIGTDELIWELYDDETKPFMTIGLGPSNYIRSQISNGLNSNMIAISSLQCFNQQEAPVYLELLAPFEDNPHYDKSIPMVELSWKQGPPIGGIADLESMIISLQPILFKMDHITSEKIMNYMFPAKEKMQAIISPVPKQPSISTVLNSQGIRRSPSVGSLSSGRSSSEGKDFDSPDTTSVFSSSDAASIIKRNPKKITTSILNQPDENINEMVKRSGTFFNVKTILIKKTTMSVCYKGAHHVLTDVNNLIVKVPNLTYVNKVWSRDEFFAALKRDITKVVVQHLGTIIGNKFIPHKKENKLKASMDISQLLSLEARTENSSIASSNYHVHRIKKKHSGTSSKNSKNTTIPTNDDSEVKPFFPTAEDTLQ